MKKKKAYIFIISGILIGCIAWLWSGTASIFEEPYSTVVYARDGRLLGAHIATDEQWRFPLIDSVPKNFSNAVTTFEDKRFYQHLGIDFLAIARAAIGNIKACEITSGASTITMQTIRLSRKGKVRSLWQKIIEATLAVRLELKVDKKQILRLYASHAPFGGNVVGLETASWRYFQKHPSQLSVAESALLAVLPNAPSLIHLSKNRSRLLNKRNRLLEDMLAENLLDSLSYELALLEKIPNKPYPLPRLAPHLTHHLESQSHKITGHHSTINLDIQKRVNEIADFHHRGFAQSGIHNMGIIILDTYTGEVLAYLGNAPNTKEESAVDMIHAQRSSGSILKPFLYAHMINEGLLAPEQFVKDIPTEIAGFKPRNYNRKYSGAISAKAALAQSLNVPAVNMLHEYNVNRFLTRLSEMGITTLDKSADHYGLSLILGGGEVNLWELAGAYASMGRVLSRFTDDMSRYNHIDFKEPTLTKTEVNASDKYQPNLLSAGAIYHTFQAMEEVNRPDQEGKWQSFSSRTKVAWKTGTSYGHRDAWAIGVTKKYTTAVWVGNADGEGINDLVGVKKAAPVLFDIFNSLPKDQYFSTPTDALIPTVICRQTGHLATHHCSDIDTLMLTESVTLTSSCPYHETIYTNNNGLRAYADCSIESLQNESWLVLPSIMEYYYKNHNSSYQTLPAFSFDCRQNKDKEPIAFIYPDEGSDVYLPLDLDGNKEKLIVKATHKDRHEKLYWHIDKTYLGETEELHTMSLYASAGKHTLTIVDQHGNELKRQFNILGE